MAISACPSNIRPAGLETRFGLFEQLVYLCFRFNDSLVMRYFAFLSWMILSITLVSCEKTEKDPEQKEDGFLEVGDALSENDLQGTWTIVDEYGTKTITFDKGTYFKTEAERGWEPTHREYGTYTYENGVITWKFNKFEYRSFDFFDTNDYFDWQEEIPDENQIRTRTAKVRSLYDKSALVIAEYVSPYSDYQPVAMRRSDDFVIIYYREGARIPSDARAIQGKWNWMAHYADKEDELWESIEFKGNSFELIKYNSWNRFTGTFSFENGYLTFHVTGWYDGGWSKEQNDYVWTSTDKMWTVWQNWDSYEKPFLPVNDTTCLSRVSGFNSIFVKQ